MKYSDGNDVKLGDKVRLGRDKNGVVVCSIDDQEYSDEFPESQWSYLKEGVMINFPMWGLIHYVEPEDDLELLARKS
ncbi:hypothetical protein [Dyella agri]|uniref:Phage protein n=1 Tax=Dyella agri TaxID=1926869 RepID=A0ABW8KIG6_9GAMM